MSASLPELVAALRLGDPPSTGKRTICEVLRELARDALGRGDVASLERILEATLMAKSMQRKLVKNLSYIDGTTVA